MEMSAAAKKLYSSTRPSSGRFSRRKTREDSLAFSPLSPSSSSSSSSSPAAV